MSESTHGISFEVGALRRARAGRFFRRGTLPGLRFQNTLCILFHWSLWQLSFQFTIAFGFRCQKRERRVPSPRFAPISEFLRPCGFEDRLAHAAFRAYSRSVGLPELFRRVFSWWE